MLPLEVFVIFKFFHVLATIREKVENGKKKNSWRYAQDQRQKLKKRQKQKQK